MKKKYEVIRSQKEYGLFSAEGFTKKEMKKAAKKGLHHYSVTAIKEGCMPALLSGIVAFSGDTKEECAGEMLTTKPLTSEDMVYCVNDELTVKEFIVRYKVSKCDDTLICAYVKDGKYAPHNITNDDNNDFMTDLQAFITNWMGQVPEVLIYDQKCKKKKKKSIFNKYESADFDRACLLNLLENMQKHFPIFPSDENDAKAEKKDKVSSVFRFQIDTNLSPYEVKALANTFHQIFKGNPDYVNTDILVHSSVFDPDYDEKNIETDVYMDWTSVSNSNQSLIDMGTTMCQLVDYLKNETIVKAADNKEKNKSKKG